MAGYASDSENENDRHFKNLTDNSGDGFTKPRPRKIAKTLEKTNDNISAVNTSNRYGILTEEPMEIREQAENTGAYPKNQSSKQTTQQTKKIWVPPIVIFEKIGNYQDFNRDIFKQLGHNNFLVSYKTTKTIIKVQRPEDRTKLMEDFHKSKILFHTFTPEEEKTKKIVMKAGPNMNIQTLKEDLKAKGQDVNDIIKLKTHRNDISFSYLVTVNKKQPLQDLRNIRNIHQCQITWEKYNKKRDYTQCHKCQQFGHAENNCFLRPRCVKCPQFHHWKDCNLKKSETSKAYCHNCGGDHAATYQKCPSLLDYLQKRNELSTQKNVPRKATTQPPTTETVKPPRQPQHQGIYDNVHNSYQKPKLSYREATENVYHGDMENSNCNNDFGELIKLINLMKKIKFEISNCTNQFDKMTTICKYLDQF